MCVGYHACAPLYIPYATHIDIPPCHNAKLCSIFFCFSSAYLLFQFFRCVHVFQFSAPHDIDIHDTQNCLVPKCVVAFGVFSLSSGVALRGVLLQTFILLWGGHNLWCWGGEEQHIQGELRVGATLATWLGWSLLTIICIKPAGEA